MRIEKKLNNYYSNLLNKRFKEELLCEGLDIEFANKNEFVEVLAKPKKYQNFTKIRVYIKENALYYLMDMNEIIKETKSLIKNLNQNDRWL